MDTSLKDLIIRLAFVFVIFTSTGKAIVSVQEYCDKFNSYSVKPLICLLKIQNVTAAPSPESEWETEEEDDDCSCSVNCFPVFDATNDSDTDMDRNLLSMSDLRCQPCGASCPVNSLSPRCNCAALGPSTTNGPRCKCSVTCAANAHQATDPFCIFNVTRIYRLRDPTRLYTCECDKSKAAENSPFPDFACVCQPSL